MTSMDPQKMSNKTGQAKTSIKVMSKGKIINTKGIGSQREKEDIEVLNRI